MFESSQVKLSLKRTQQQAFSPSVVLFIPNIVTHRSHVCAQGNPDAEEPEAPEPCEPDRGVPEEAEAAPRV